jgi:retron-type reverse transcriptase
MAKSLFKLVRSANVLKNAWLVIQRNGRTSKSPETREEIAIFAEDAGVYLDRIQRQLRNKKFTFKPAKGVRVKKPGKSDFRPIVIAPVESRIVQRAVHDVMMTVPGIEALVRSVNSFGGVRGCKEDDYSAVPAAIKAVLEGIKNGGAYIVRSDISKFFTRIPKPAVRKIIETVISDQDFLSLYDTAVALELSNMQKLRDDAKKFPIEEIGVAQGNSISSMMGNILLKDFDDEMNNLSNIRCIRFIDDFLVLGPNKATTLKAFSRAEAILSKWQMTLAKDKTDKASIREPFEFLGIEFCNGLIRPTKKKRQDHNESIKVILENSKIALFNYKAEDKIDRKFAVLKSLTKVSDSMHSWGMHYRFCNDANCLAHLDKEIALLIDEYFRTFRSILNAKGQETMWDLLGIQSLQKIERNSLRWEWPTSGSKHQP